MDDERIDFLLDNLTLRAQAGLTGFANYTIMVPELVELLIEVKRFRNKPLHCPCCDGDHL